ncbi:CNH domain-containing protein [Pilaira anomala]|nr:CNH domain-containing protein [Pilaira anomala]
MSNQQHHSPGQHHQYYNSENGQDSAYEVDAMLNSLVGSQPRPSMNGYEYNQQPQHSNYFNYYSDNNVGPPQLPPRTENNGYHGNMEGSSSYQYPSDNNYYGYPPPSQVYGQYPPQQQLHTPLPQRVSSIVNNNSMIDSSTPPAVNPMYSMPTPNYQQQQQQQESVYPPVQYRHQRNYSEGTTSPPGSPPRYPQVQPYQTITGYPDGTEELITNSYRPVFVPNHSDTSTNVSTPNDTPPTTNPGFRPTTSQSSYNQQNRRPPSSLRSTAVINTIERPKYTYLPESENAEDGEVPFIPVSPDTDSDEEYFVRPTQPHRANEYSTDDYDKTPPVQQQQQQQHQHQPEPVLNNKNNITYNDPTQFYMYPPHPVTDTPPPLPPVVQAPIVAQTETQNQAPALPRHQEPVRPAVPARVIEPNYGLLSVLSTSFIRHVKGLENVRELWCASEYNESFTGSEAVIIIKGLLNDQVPEEYCVNIANALMRCKPALFSPTQYSQRSLISNTMYNSDDTYFLEEDISDDNLPVGVIPSLTPCYSYVCRPGQGGCYSDRCPNNGKDFVSDNKVEVTVSRNASYKSTSSPVGGWLMPHEAWSAGVDREFLKTLDSKEIGRQEVLNETIYSEEKYLSDLTILHEVVVQGLERSGAIDSDRLPNFIQTVFNNYQELVQISEALFRDLLARFRDNIGKCVPTIGDILIQHMQFFEKPYVTYSPQALMAKYLAEQEIKNNSEFERFTREITKHERTDRLPIWHYLLCPVTRMQRYPLLIEGLLKKTPKDHPDHIFLTRSYDIIRSVASKADNQALHIKNRLNILNIRDRIIFKQGEAHDLLLDNPNRRLYHKGTLKRRSGTLDVADKNDIYAFVFDHMVVMTKMRKTSTGEEYRLWKKPIPLQMLAKYQSTGTNNASVISGMNPVSTGVTLTLHHLGSRGGAVYPFFCSTVEEKQEWTKAIDDAKASMKKRHGDSDVFELKPLDDVNFRLGNGQPNGTTTRINCSVPFLSCRQEKKIAIGTDNGVFFKTEGQESVRRIIQCESVVQLDVIEKYHILIVLTEKALRAYPIDVLDSKSNTKAIDRIEAEIATNVNFFQIGFCNGRDMLVYKKKKNTSSVFVALEPFCDLRNPKNEKFLTVRPSLFNTRLDYLKWFKRYKDFYIGADASNIHFLKAKLNIVCERGFEVIDPENLTVGRDIPDTEDPEFYFVTRHAEPLKPLAMYRINDKFLLCYDKFAFYVNNRNGSLVPRADKRKPATVCDWEGTPTHIVYDHPYIIAIDPYFIEVRHVETVSGELNQIISGENIRLAYYNGGGEKPIIHVCMSHSQKPDTQALFQLVLNSQRNSTGYTRRS